MSSERFDAKRAEALRIARMVRSPISRRGLLELAGWSALTGALAGCCPTKDQSNGGEAKKEALEDGSPRTVKADLKSGYPHVTWEEGVAAVDQFIAEAKIKLFPESPVHSLCLMTSDKEPKKYMEVLFDPGREKPALAEKFTYKYPENQDNTVPVQCKPSKMAEPNVRIGHTARGVDPTAPPMSKCTAGWNILFNTHVACVSCFHVLCARGTSSVVGSQPVELNDAVIARLYCFQPVTLGTPSAPNLWDLAIAEYNNPWNAEGWYRRCGDGNYVGHPSTPAYPMALTPLTDPPDPGDEDTYHKVGAASPICGYGRLEGVGATVSIPLLSGIAYFRGALKFTKLAGPGDSGAIIVRDRDNSVSGLHFASNATHSYSNPLYQIPWTRVMPNHVLPNGDPIPRYNCAPQFPGQCC